MNSFAAILIRSGAAFAIAFVGAASSALLARTHRQLCALISLGAGTLLGVAVFAILPECFEALPWWNVLLAGATGYALFAIISKYVFHVCPACAASHFDEATTHRFGEIAVPMMIALSIHCTVDGLALSAGHQEQTAGGRTLDIPMTFAICVHKAPEGLALGSLLLGAGFGSARMLWLVVAVESTTILGAVLSWFVLREVPEVWLALALAHAAGGFLYLAAHAMIGEIVKHHKALVLANAFAGFAIIGALILIFHLRG
jgi:ZIP family zinc transporter/zinc and cadmium transporter